jgi:hypothetical protein
MIFLLPICGHWLMFALNLPICIFLAKRSVCSIYQREFSHNFNYHFLDRFFNVPRGNIGEYDPAEIHNNGMMKKHLVGVCIHLGWQMIGFFLFLYW